MKTIAYRDNAGGKLQEYVGRMQLQHGQTGELFPLEKRIERLQNALKELRPVANITVYFVDGNKARALFRKSF